MYIFIYIYIVKKVIDLYTFSLFIYLYFNVYLFIKLFSYSFCPIYVVINYIPSCKYYYIYLFSH